MGLLILISGGMKMEVLHMNKFVLLLLGMFFLSFASAQVTYQIDTEVNVTVVCVNDGYCSASSSCNININDPTGLLVIENEDMDYHTSFFNYEMNVTELGTYCVTGVCVDGDSSKEVDFTFDVTENGKPLVENVFIFMIGMVFLVFLIACFFMYMSTKANMPGFKIFFLLASIIFLMASLITGYMVASDGNVSSGINATTLSLVIVLGAILFILFLMAMIKETGKALDLLRIKQGKEWKVGASSKVTGRKDSLY